MRSRYNPRTSGEYGKGIILVEVAYHWRQNGEYGNTPTPFPQTPEGQKEFLDEVHRLMPGTPNGLGKGIFWREPAVPLRQGIASRGIFYQDGNVLPVITVSDKYTRGRADRAARANPSAGPGRDKGGTPEAAPIPAQMPTPSK